MDGLNDAYVESVIKKALSEKLTTGQVAEMEDGPRNGRKDTLALRRQVRRLQLQAFPGEVERRRRDKGRVQERLQNPDLRQAEVPETP